MTERSSYIDNIKAVLVFLVVLAHLSAAFVKYPLINAIYTFVYTFHIPLFVLVSGFLSKKSSQLGSTSVRNFLALYIFSVMSYSVFSDTLYAVFYYQAATTGDLLTKVYEIIRNAVFSVFQATGPSWYLLSLLIWRLITPYFTKKRFLAFSILAALAAGGVDQVGFTLSLSRTFVFYPFYLLGYHIDKDTLRRYASGSRLTKLAAFTVLVGILCLYRFQIIRFNYLTLYSYTSYAGCGYSLWKGLLVRGCFYAVALTISACVLVIIPQRECKITNWGRQSLNIYIWHMFLIPVVEIFNLRLGTQAWHIAPIAALSLLICAAASGHPFTRMTEGIKREFNRLLLAIH